MKKVKINHQNIFTLLFFTVIMVANGQISSRIYADTVQNNGVNRIHQVKISGDYFIYNEYEIEPSNFIKTLGGFLQIEETEANSLLVVLLEFNSDYNKDAIRKLSIPIKMDGENLELNWFKKLSLKPVIPAHQDLDGAWLFATRGPDTGQERRNEKNSRKTLKFLKDGIFQWIAYDTDSFKFSGSGGGSYLAKDDVYTEQIEFFSKDASRVGATLKFNYALQGNDWHHTGKNSKGEPMYEIWCIRQVMSQ